MPSTATRSVAPFAAVPTADRNDGWEIVVFQNESYFDTQFSKRSLAHRAHSTSGIISPTCGLTDSDAFDARTVVIAATTSR